MSEKKYSAPQLIVKGKLESLTQGQSTGSTIDASFVGRPAGTVITFS